MLPPHELKSKEFPKVMRGYSMVDVDEHIEFMIEKYTDLYRANDELERKLQKCEAELKEYKGDEESIRSALINAQRASAKIISEANERADVIIRSAKTNCDKIVAEFNEQIKEERENLIQLRNVIADFKASLFRQYTSHIEYIETIAPESTGELDTQLASEDYTKLVVERIKKDISAGNVQEYGTALQKPAKNVEQVVTKTDTLPQTLDVETKPVSTNMPVDEDVLDKDMAPTRELPLKEILANTIDTSEKSNDASLDIDDIVIPQREPKPKRDYLPDRNANFEDIEDDIDEDEPELEVKQKPAIPERSQSRQLSMKDRIKELNKKFDDDDDAEDEDDNNFDDDYDDFVKTMETNKSGKKKKNKSRQTEDDDTYI